MNANDHDNVKRLDEYIDALNAGKPAPQLAGDAELSGLFVTARDLQRLRLAEPPPDDVPSRLAAALERELRANPTHATRRIGSTDMSRLRDASSNGTIRPPEDTGGAYGLAQRPDRGRQMVQIALAAIAFIIVGVILTQIIGSGNGDEPGSAVGVDPGASPTTEVTTPNSTIATVQSITPTPTTYATATSGDEPGGAIATPDQSGAYNVLTFAEARELTEFELIAPDSVPQELTLEGIKLYPELDMSTPGSIKAGPVDLVAAYYPHIQSGSVHFSQTTRGCNDPGMVGAVHDDIEIDGREIRRTLGTNQSGDPLASYRWQSGDICYTVFAILEDGVDEELLAAFVASIPLPEAGAEPTPSALTADPLPRLGLSLDYVTCDETVTARGASFEPGTTITIHGGRLIGDNFAPVVDEHPVGDDGRFEVELNLARLIRECDGGSEEIDGSQYRLVASTGTSLTKDGLDVDGPSAMTVLSFSREVPESIRNRTP